MSKTPSPVRYLDLHLAKVVRKNPLINNTPKKRSKISDRCVAINGLWFWWGFRLLWNNRVWSKPFVWNQIEKCLGFCFVSSFLYWIFAEHPLVWHGDAHHKIRGSEVWNTPEMIWPRSYYYSHGRGGGAGAGAGGRTSSNAHEDNILRLPSDWTY